jgi:hypothetical protein
MHCGRLTAGNDPLAFGVSDGHPVIDLLALRQVEYLDVTAEVPPVFQPKGCGGFDFSASQWESELEL